MSIEEIRAEYIRLGWGVKRFDDAVRQAKARAFEEGVQAEKNREPFVVPANPYEKEA